jgi:tetratricopeptide (TPR) repeat protein
LNTSTLSSLALALVALVHLGCAATRPPLTCPAHGGGAWTETTSKHFVLHTDAPATEAERIVAEFEQLHDALAFVTRRPASVEVHIEVVRFERRKDFLETVGHDTTIGAYFTTEAPGDLEPRPTLVLHAEDMSDTAQETFLHELTHRFLADRFATLPHWLNEGLAQYYETLHLVGGRAVVGATGASDFSDRTMFWASWRGNAQTLQIPIAKAPTIWSLVDSDASSFSHRWQDARGPSNDEHEKLIANYAGAWKLVHYLLDGPDARDRSRFATFIAALERGERPRDVFLHVFGDEMPHLQEAYHRYLTTVLSATRVVELPTASATASPTSRTMTDDEVHLAWARLLPRTKAFEAQVTAQLDEALASASSPEVQYARAVRAIRAKDFTAADREISVALAARPEEPRYLLAKVLAFQASGREAPRELSERLARAATSGWQLGVAAMEAHRAGRLDDGLALVGRAIAVDPACLECQNVRARLLLAKGSLDEALAAVDRLLSLLPDGARVVEVVNLRRKIELARSKGSAP